MAPLSSARPPLGLDVDHSERILLCITEEGSRDLCRGSVSVPQVLDEAGFACDAFVSIDALYDSLREGAGAIVVTADVVTEEAVRLLLRTLDRRPPWSNLPIVVLTSEHAQLPPPIDALGLFNPDTSGNLTLLQCPVHAITLTTVVRSALRARRRQYEVRDLLEGLKAANAELRASEEALQQANAGLEARVSERTEQVRNLSLAVSAAEQRERTRISRVLHDHLQQIIHSAKMWAELARDEPSTIEQALPRLSTLLDEALTTTRTLTVELNPPVLQESGLGAALDWLGDHMAERHGLQIHVDVDPALQITDADLRTVLFRTIRELLFNVVKHAGVREARVTGRRLRDDAASAGALAATGFEEPEVSAPDCIRLSVQDEGVGFDPEAVRGGSGLSGAREHLSLIGGRLHVDTAPDRGTHVTLDVPVDAAQTVGTA